MSIIQAAPPLHGRPDPRTKAEFVRVLVVGFALAAACLPLFVLQLRQTWKRDYYEFVPLVLVGAGVLLYSRRQDFGQLEQGRPWVSYAVLAIAWMLLAIAELLYSPWLGGVATLVVLLAIFYGIGGASLLVKALPAWAFLWLALPPPFRFDRDLILQLQERTTILAGSAMDTVGISHVVFGNVIEIGGRSLFIDEACSGVNSLFAVLACTLFFNFLARRPIIQGALLLAFAVGWVLAANVLRIMLVAYLLVAWKIDVASGWKHDALGFLLFLVALIVIWSTDKLLSLIKRMFKRDWMMPPENYVAANSPCVISVPSPAWVSKLRSTWLASLPVALAFGFLASVHFLLYGVSVVRTQTPAGIASTIEALDAADMPTLIEPWQRQAFNIETRPKGSAEGEFSKIWTYRQHDLVGFLSLDYPFTSWHPLTWCYTGRGWKIDRETAYAAQTRPDGAGYTEVEFTKSAYNHRYLLFCNLDEQGVSLEPTGNTSLQILLTRRFSAIPRKLRNIMRSIDSSDRSNEGEVYELQLLVDSHNPLSEAEREQVKLLFLEGVRSLRKHLAKQRG